MHCSDPAVVAKIVSKLLFNHACNKNLETEIEGSRQLGSEVGYFRFSSQVGLDFLKNKTGLEYVGLPPRERVVLMIPGNNLMVGDHRYAVLIWILHRPGRAFRLLIHGNCSWRCHQDQSPNQMSRTRPTGTIWTLKRCNSVFIMSVHCLIREICDLIQINLRSIHVG